MTEIEAGAEITGHGGAKFKAISSFPKIVEPCKSALDKINGLKKITYVNHHTNIDGKTTVTKSTVKRKIL